MTSLLVTLAALTTVSALASATDIGLNVSETSDEPHVNCFGKNISLSISSGEIEPYYISSSSLRCLTIKNSYIYRVHRRAFDNLTNLRYLNLENNAIWKDELFSFGDLPTVKALLMNNQRKDDDWITTRVNSSVYPQLERLELRNASIRYILTNWSYSFPALKLLDLSMNSISYSPLPRSITHLRLNRNIIWSLSLENINSLRTLEVDNNYIQVLGNDGMHSLSLKGQTNLTRLSVADNQITSISSDAFEDTLNLRYLDLSSNYLISTSLIGVAESLQSLDVLLLDNNYIYEIPFNRTMQLTTLSMNCNSLRELALRPLLNMPFLKKLYLGWNNIYTIHPYALRLQIHLEELYLNDNQLSYLPPGWNDYLDSLRVLDLSGNKFTLLYSLFQSTPSPSLQNVYFERNPLKKIFMGALHNIPDNLTVHFQDLPGRLNSSCHVNWPSTTTEWQNSTSPDYWTTSSPDYSTTGTHGYPTSGTPDYPTTGTPDYSTTGTPGYWTTSSPNYWTTGTHGYPTSGTPDYSTTGTHGYWTTSSPTYLTT